MENKKEIIITANDIEKLLEKKHGQDVFVRQCKTGSSGRGNLILDAWVMPKSWAHMNTIGYEIKVSRGDFLQDGKWMDYLPYCHSFYFVCPQNLISVDELPPEIGLMWVSPSGKKLYTKKKAVIRDVEVPSSLFYYLLMWRTHTPIDERIKESHKDILRKYVKHKKWNESWGHSFGKRLSKIIKEKINSVESDNRRLKSEIEAYKMVEKFLKDNGLDDISYYAGTYGQSYFKRDLEKLQKPFNGKLDYELDGAIQSLTKIRDTIFPNKKDNTK